MLISVRDEKYFVYLPRLQSMAVCFPLGDDDRDTAMNTRKRILLPVCAALAMIPLILLKAQEAAPLREPGVAINPGLGLSEGRVSPPFTPVEEQLGGMVSYDNGFLVNMSLDVDMSPGLRLFFGMIGNVQRKLLASANGMGNGFWVYEQTGYESQ